ncbi:hypothetical protein [Kurthia massiliensis]|uniref:hypothetical protein n=1 Tax=Kurthia massiliensis TaxID=1033739 RepID=UPI000287A38D|nr:hypothetical protein [Kurthia massiliensis]
MDGFAHKNWCALIRQGTYLVCTTPSAAQSIDEQCLKQKALREADHEMAALLYQHDHISYGQPYIAFRKLYSLLATMLERQEETALKDFAFILFTLLQHSTYKSLIKSIEKKSNRLDDEEAFFQFINEPLDDETRDTYRLIFSFTYGITQMRRYVLKNDLKERKDLALAVAQQNECVKDVLDERTMPIDHTTFTEPVPAELLTDDVIRELAAQGIYVRDVPDILLSESQLECATTDNIALMIAVNQLKQFSEALLAGTPTEQAPTQKVITKKIVKKPASTAKLEKEIAQLKEQLDVERKRNTAMETTIKSLQAENASLQQDIYKLKEEQAEFESLLDAPAISDTATALVEQLQHNVARLVSELQLKPVAPIVSALDEMKGLKVAVIGGHPQYHAQLKQDWPGPLLTIGPKEISFDQKKLKNYDVVVFSSSHSSHSLYNRAFDYLKAHQLKHKCLQMDTQKNAKALAEEIVQFLKR